MRKNFLLALSFLIIIRECGATNNISCLISNCSSCSNPIQCNQCYFGSILINGTCLYCPTLIGNCLFCDAATPNSNLICSACQGGFYLNNTNCLACSYPCQTCSSQITCKTCIPGLYLNQNSSQCESCQVLNCRECSSPGNCTACLKSYYLNGSQCVPCGFGCQQCSQSQCIICLPAYSIITPCIPCVANCIYCLNQQVCQECSYGYIQYFSNQYCTACTNFVSYCANCIFDLDFNFICTSCMQGYYLNWTANFYTSTFNSNCVPCPSNCAYCEARSQGPACIYCINGFYLNNSCFACPSGCSSCQDSSTCSYCAIGYYSSGPLCIQCSQNCQNCNGSTCLSCPIPYFPQNSSCVNCSQYISNCYQCYEGICLTCNLGYYLSNASSCLSCQPNCGVCFNDGTVCLVCFPTFYAVNGSCVSCYPCNTCVNSTYCLTCPSNVSLNTFDSTCPVCPNCLDCYFYRCMQCADKYILQTSNNECISIYELNSLRWWQSSIILVVSLIAVHFLGISVIWLRNRTDGYLGEEDNVEAIELESISRQ